MEFNSRLKLISLLLVLITFLLFGLEPVGATDRQEMIRQRLEAEIVDLEAEVQELKEKLEAAHEKNEELEELLEEREEQIRKLKEEDEEIEREVHIEPREPGTDRTSREEPPEREEEPEITEEPGRREVKVDEDDEKIERLTSGQIQEDDQEREGKLWAERGDNYSIRRFPLDYELTIITRPFDNLSRIAHQYYRDAGYSIALYRANSNRLPDRRTLPPQTRLQLPSYEEVSGSRLHLTVRENPARVIEQDLEKSGELWREENLTYPLRRQPLDYELTLRTGSRDNLTRLAHQYYGDSSYWDNLYEVNTDTVENPDVLPSGTRLRLPPLAELQE